MRVCKNAGATGVNIYIRCDLLHVDDGETLPVNELAQALTTDWPRSLRIADKAGRDKGMHFVDAIMITKHPCKATTGFDEEMVDAKPIQVCQYIG